MRTHTLLVLFLMVGIAANFPLKEFNLADINIIDAGLFTLIAIAALYGANKLSKKTERQAVKTV